MEDNRKSVKITRHYRMYVPGDQGMFSPEEAAKIVSGGFGKVVGEKIAEPVSEKTEAPVEKKEEVKQPEPEKKEEVVGTKPRRTKYKDRMLDAGEKKGSEE
jgi:hypothetical protein